MIIVVVTAQISMDAQPFRDDPPNVTDKILAKDQGTLVLFDLGDQCISGTCYGCTFWEVNVYGYGCENSSSCNQVPELSNTSSVDYGSVTFSNSSTGTYIYNVMQLYQTVEPDVSCDVQENGPFEYDVFNIVVIDWQWTGTISYCEGENDIVNLDNIISHADGVSYSGPGVVGNTWNPQDAGSGTHTITASKSFSNGTQTISLQATVHPNPSVSFADPSAFCKTDSDPDLTNWINISGGTFSHSHGNSLDLYGSANENIDIASSTPGSYQVTYTYTDENGCSNSSTANITIDPIITIDAGANQEACENSGQITLVAATSGVSWECVDCDYVVDGKFDSDIAPPGTYTIRASKTEGACSDTDDKTFTVKALPVVEAGPGLTKCINDGTFSLTGASPTGGVWTASCSGCLGGSAFDPNAAGAGEHTVTYTYTNAGGCVNSDFRSITVIALPDANEISVTEDERCGDGEVDLQASLSGHTLKWYSNPSGGSTLHTGNSYSPTIATGTSTYYVEAINGDGCISPSRKPVTATAYEVPLEPNTSDGSRCGPGTVTLSASGGIQGATYEWFENPTGGSSLHSGPSFQTPSLSSSRSYYVEAVSADGCISPTRATADAVIQSIPGGPTVFDGSRCGPGTVSLSVGGAPSGGDYRWYADESGGSSFNNSSSWVTPSLNATTSYWVSIVTAEQCEGPRSEITATIYSVPNAPTSVNGERCGNGTVDLSANAEVSGTYNWYETTFSTTIIHSGQQFTTPTLTDSRSYWVSITDGNGCESPRTEVLATLNPVPSAPDAVSVGRCGPGEVTIMASGGIENAVYKWYDNPTGGSALYTGAIYEPDVTVTRNFYVSATSPEICTSTSRTAVTVTIHPFPGPPVTFDNSRCGDGSVMLNAGGAQADGSYRWYENESGGTSFNDIETWETPVLGASRDYYVSIVSPYGCEGNRESVTAIIHEIPPMPDVVPMERCGEGTLELAASAAIPGTFNWYETQFSTSSISNVEILETPVLESSEDYWVSITDLNTCESERAEVQATIHPIPEDPIAEDVDRCGEGILIINASGGSEAVNYRWYDAPSGGNSLFIGESFEPFVSVTRNFYLDALSDANCVSNNRTVVTVTVHPFPAPPVTFEDEHCGEGSVILNVGGSGDGGTYSWYADASGGTPFHSGERWETPTLSESTTYYASIVSAEGCEGNREPITAVIHEIPDAPTGTPGSNCGAGSIDLSVSSEISGVFNWYETEFSSTSIFEGQYFSSPLLNESRSYWTSITDDNGCEGTRSEINATINAIPDVPVSPDTARCGPGDVILIVSESVKNVIYEWFDTNTGIEPISEGTSLTVNVSSTRDYFVGITSEEGCSGFRKQVRATVNSVPDIPSVVSNDICGSGAIALSAGGAPTGGNYRWYEDDDDPDTLATGSTFETPELVNSTSYFVSIMTPEGCEGQREEVFATVNNIPERPVGDDASRCGPGPSTLSVSSSVTNPRFNWYFEENGGNPFANGEAYTIANLTETTSYWVSVVSETGCESSRERVTAEYVDITPIEIGQDTTLCINSAKLDLFEDVSIHGGVFTGSGVINGEFHPSVAGAGTHAITYSLVNPVGCATEGSRIIAVISDQSGGESLDIGEVEYPVCMNEGTIDLTLFPNIPDGSWTGSGVTLGVFDPLVAGEGPNTLTYTVQVNGCTAIKEKEMVVLAVPDIPVVNADSIVVCAGGTGELSASGGTPGTIYRWFLEGGTESFGTGETIVFTPDQSGLIRVQAENAFGCVSEFVEVTVEVSEIHADFDASKYEVTLGERVDFISNLDKADSYLWDFGDELTSSESKPSHYYYDEGSFTVSLNVTTGDCKVNVVKENLISVSTEEVEEVLGLDDPNFQVLAYPVPFSDEIALKVEVRKPGTMHVDVYDLSGIKVLGKVRYLDKGEHLIMMDGTSLPGGLYLVKVKGSEMIREVKVVKR